MGLLKKTVTLILGLSALLSVAKAQDDCPTADLRNRNWPALHRHQPGRGWCYAVVTSDLLSAETGSRISAVALANHTERSRDSYQEKVKAYIYREPSLLYRFSFLGQNFETAITVAKKDRVCTYSVIDQLRDTPEIREDFLDTVFYDLEALRKKDLTKLRARLHQLFDPLRAGLADQILERSQKSLKPIIDHAVDLTCDNAVDVSMLTLNTRDMNKISEETAIATLNTLLTAGKAVAIGYHDKLISAPGSIQREATNHASTLVGQYRDPQDHVCKYIIRATDLFTCEVADKSVPCKDGYFVVPRKQALEATGDFMWLQR